MFSAASVRHSVHRGVVVGGGGVDVHVTITHNALVFTIEGPLVLCRQKLSFVIYLLQKKIKILLRPSIVQTRYYFISMINRAVLYYGGEFLDNEEQNVS